MMLFLTLVALLFCLFASYIREAAAATVAAATTTVAAAAANAEVETAGAEETFATGEERPACRRMAFSAGSIGAISRQQTAAPPE